MKRFQYNENSSKIPQETHIKAKNQHDQMNLKDKIHTIRDKQVMLDRDLAELYNIETRVLKQSVNRNLKRFPKDFLFSLTDIEIEFLVSQNVIPSNKHLGGAKPYAFTEQGVAMLSSALSSEKAIEINIRIMRAFVEMRHFIQNNANIFQKFQQIDQKLLTHDENFNEIFKAMESKQLTPDQGIFFDGQIYDAYKFIKGLVNSAKESIVLIDNYINEETLTILCNKNVEIRIYTKEITEELKLAEEKFNQQHKNLEIIKFNKSHDRFLIIDNQTYHIGASLKDAGKRWFAFSRLNISLENLPKFHKKPI